MSGREYNQALLRVDLERVRVRLEQRAAVLAAAQQLADAGVPITVRALANLSRLTEAQTARAMRELAKEMDHLRTYWR